VLELALGQEEWAAADRLLAAAEAGIVDIALPSFSLSEPFVRVTRGIRDRGRVMSLFNSQVTQLARSTAHQSEVHVLQTVSALIDSIDKREGARLTGTVERLLANARLIELDLASFRIAMDYRTRYSLEPEDAIVLAVVAADLAARPGTGPQLFANRTRRDFDDLGIITDLRRLGCEVVWSFAEAARLLGVG
jgi:predicted nucleic acid-binding protein